MNLNKKIIFANCFKKEVKCEFLTNLPFNEVVVWQRRVGWVVLETVRAWISEVLLTCDTVRVIRASAVRLGDKWTLPDWQGMADGACVRQLSDIVQALDVDSWGND